MDQAREQRRFAGEDPVEGRARDACVVRQVAHREVSETFRPDHLDRRGQDALPGPGLRRHRKRLEKRLPRREVAVEARPGSTGRPGEVRHCRPAAAGEHEPGSFENPLVDRDHMRLSETTSLVKSQCPDPAGRSVLDSGWSPR